MLQYSPYMLQYVAHPEAAYYQYHYYDYYYYYYYLSYAIASFGHRSGERGRARRRLHSAQRGGPWEHNTNNTTIS